MGSAYTLEMTGKRTSLLVVWDSHAAYLRSSDIGCLTKVFQALIIFRVINFSISSITWDTAWQLSPLAQPVNLRKLEMYDNPE